MKTQVSQVISACSFYLRHINQISRFLHNPTKERVVNAIITSRLDDCNALLYGTCVGNISRPQRIHNSAPRLISRRPLSNSDRPLLQELPLLPFARSRLKQTGCTYIQRNHASIRLPGVLQTNVGYSNFRYG